MDTTQPGTAGIFALVAPVLVELEETADSENDSGDENSTPEPDNNPTTDNEPGTPGLRITEVGESTATTEGGTGDSYTVALESQPSTNVTVTITADSQVRVDGGGTTSLVFTPSNWDIPQTVAVTAVSGDFPEPSPHYGFITHSVSSSDSGYNSLSPTELTSSVTDPAECITVTGFGDGTGVNGVVTLREALQAINTTSDVGDVVYTTGTECVDMTALTGTVNISSHMMSMSANVHVYGPISRTYNLNQPTLSVSGQNLWRPFRFSAGSSSLTGFRIADGRAEGESGNSGGSSVPGDRKAGGGGGLGMGGGIFQSGGNLTIKNITFINNSAQGGAGGNRSSGSGAFLATGKNGGAPSGDSAIGGIGGVNSQDGQDGGFGTGGGGGGSQNTLEGSGGNGGYGAGGGGKGARTSSGCTVGKIPGSGGTFAGGGGQRCGSLSAGGGGGAGLGGAIGIHSGTLIISDSNFQNNTATGGVAGDIAGTGAEAGEGKGGAIFVDGGGSVTASNLSFDTNTASDSAGNATDNDNVYGFSIP